MKSTIIQQKIFELRGERVILDFDLAELYTVPTKTLNQAVKRNADRFPKDFMFRLSKKEWDFLRSQFVTLEKGRGRYPKYLPYAFTEHGVAMIANLLKSSKAIKMSLTVVRAFVALRKFVFQNKDFNIKLEELRKELYGRMGEQDVQLSAIYDAIENLLDNKVLQKVWSERDRIGFKK